MEEEFYDLRCKNAWCKAPFKVKKSDVKKVSGVLQIPKECPKCKSFNQDLSGGVTWEDREYEGNPWLGAHPISTKINKYY